MLKEPVLRPPAMLTVMAILYEACTICRPQTLFQLVSICGLLHGPLQDGCMHMWRHMWSSQIDHQCTCQSCCSSSWSLLLFMPVLTPVHRVCRTCAGFEDAPLLLARMTDALENGTCFAGRPADSFAVRNRMSLPGSLHRISAMKGDQGDIQGLTYRIGRHISGQHFPSPHDMFCSMLPTFVTIHTAPADK